MSIIEPLVKNIEYSHDLEQIVADYMNAVMTLAICQHEQDPECMFLMILDIP